MCSRTQNDLNMHSLHLLEETFTLDETPLFSNHAESVYIVSKCVYAFADSFH